jgi:threonylcarbamoyladenosine tRNA methylthiotransferase MtaB
MSLFSVAFQTLGCKLNQVETESVVSAFQAQGFRVVGWGEPADLFIINTCTVTSKAEQKARRVIRRALKENPAACLIATGCYAQLEGPALRSLGSPGRVLVVPGDQKDRLLDLPGFLADTACASADLPLLVDQWLRDHLALDSPIARTLDPPWPSSPVVPSPRFRFDVQDFAFHSRAFLKIQDGCDHICAYCRVRLARGKSQSLEKEVVLQRLRELENRGYTEAVLTGINLNLYRDLSGDGAKDPSEIPSMDLSGLLTYLLRGTEKIALRISSTEPEGITADFARIAAHRRIRPHFHISVQSGSDRILALMRRGYTARRLEEGIRLLRSVKGDPFLACDIIAGFPGETEEDFEATYDLCERIGFAWIHAFPFSPRPGTEAETMTPRVPERIAVQRVDRLITLARRLRGEYLDRWVGREVWATSEASHPLKNSNRTLAVSENYLKLIIPSTSPIPPGTELRCRIIEPIPLVQDPLGEDESAADGIASLIE